MFAFSCLEEISIPSSVKVIKSSSFKDCYNLEKVIFSNNCNVKRIERFAFYGCRRLKSFSIPDKVTVISMKSFAFTGLKEIEIPSSIQKVEYMAFYNCKDLVKIIFNEGLRILYKFSFANNYSLESVDLPDTLYSIKSYAFLNCTNLQKVNTTSQSLILNEIEFGVFENTKIEELTLNQSIEKYLEQQNTPYLNNIKFYDNYSKNFRIYNDGTIYLSNKLVFVPHNLEYLKVNRNCQSFAPYVLNGLKNLTTIEFMNDPLIDDSCFPNRSSNNIKNIKFNGIRVYYKNYYEQNTRCSFKSLEVLEYSITAKIYDITPYFACQKLQKVILPFRCRCINERAFKNCINLKTIEFLTDDEMLNTNQCSSDMLKEIKDEAFYNCCSLTSILLPFSVVNIGKRVFMNCSKLKHIEFGIKIIESDKKSIIYYRSYKSLNLISIGNNAFKNCTSLESFSIPSSCYRIGSSAFMNCTSLRSIEYHGFDLQTIKYRTFYNCTSLTYFKIDSSNANTFSLDFESFMNCSSLKEIIIDVKFPKKYDFSQSRKPKIHRKAFCNCTSLVRARFFIPNLDKIFCEAFMNCSSLKLLEINSIFHKLILNQNFDLSTYNGVPDDFKIKLFDKQKLVQVIQNVSKKKFNNQESEGKKEADQI